MKKKQKTTAEVQAAIFRREHRKKPVARWREADLEEGAGIGFAGIRNSEGHSAGRKHIAGLLHNAAWQYARADRADTYGGTGCILIEVRLSGYGRAFQLHDPETLQEDFEAEEQRLRKERREALQDWVGTNGVEACRAEVEKIWNGA